MAHAYGFSAASSLRFDFLALSASPNSPLDTKKHSLPLEPLRLRVETDAEGGIKLAVVQERFQSVISQLFQRRIKRCGGAVDDDMANIIVAQLLYLDAVDPSKRLCFMSTNTCYAVFFEENMLPMYYCKSKRRLDADLSVEPPFLMAILFISII
ncbi:hypothetical protein SAY86_006609 [Trapa natans]|uniref:Uncharacterized protein n=1 Tax=Trapa natans TaxID=22666 RepID=A0AAN7L4T8_TRANT|nr:hypothetical protein SAY86_006609 [Trapa natans]